MISNFIRKRKKTTIFPKKGDWEKPDFFHCRNDGSRYPKNREKDAK